MLHDGTPQTAADCLVARMMIGEVIGALDDLAAVGIASTNLQVLRASAAAVTARLDRQIAAAWATLEHAPNGMTFYGAN
jgi:hypothetical protein